MNGGKTSTGTIGEVREALNLVRDYAKQETVDPLKRIGRYLAFGLAGSILLTFGLMFLTIGVLRLLQEQTDTALTGNWSFVPYLVSLIALVVMIGGAMAAIRRGKP